MNLKILGDYVKLRQVLSNLLTNATKFTPEGGIIRVTAERSGDDLVVSVSDTGIGLKPEDTERIFESFEQVDTSYARKYRGVGLGLTLARYLVELHGGRIWAESEGEGKGSTFRFTIPIEEAAQETA